MRAKILLLIALILIELDREKDPSHQQLVVRHHPLVLAIGLVLSIRGWKDRGSTVDGLCLCMETPR